jgi:hypothetical protein
MAGRILQGAVVRLFQAEPDEPLTVSEVRDKIADLGLYRFGETLTDENVRDALTVLSRSGGGVYEHTVDGKTFWCGARPPRHVVPARRGARRPGRSSPSSSLPPPGVPHPGDAAPDPAGSAPDTSGASVASVASGVRRSRTPPRVTPMATSSARPKPGSTATLLHPATMTSFDALVHRADEWAHAIAQWWRSQPAGERRLVRYIAGMLAVLVAVGLLLSIT